MSDLGGDVISSAAGTPGMNSHKDSHHNQRKLAFKTKVQWKQVNCNGNRTK